MAAFAASAAPAESPTSFDGSASSDADGMIARYDWEFGDGATLPNGGPTPTHAYAAAVTYTVTLKVTDDDGCSTELIFTGQTVSCNGGPAAQAVEQVTISAPPPPGTAPPPPGTAPPPPGTAPPPPGTAPPPPDIAPPQPGTAPPPPDTRITRARISSAKHKASLKFKAMGEASGFQCKVKRNRTARFKRCTSPKTYGHLKRRGYLFAVRAVVPGGKDLSPAKKRFKIE